eukprot:Colp12_sorted_trinity150504_noHs@15124
MVTQRQESSLALVVPNFHRNELHVNAPNMPTLVLPLDPPADVEETFVEIWGDPTPGIDMGEEAAIWFSKYLNKPGCRLLRAHEKSSHPRMITSKKFKVASYDQCQFADWGPFLAASENSLAGLNERLRETVEQAGDVPVEGLSEKEKKDHPKTELGLGDRGADGSVQMWRFRPNIVVSGTPAFDEDSWAAVRISGLQLRNLKPCTRCQMTTVNQLTGKKESTQPLKQLQQFRVLPDPRLDAPCFGVNLAPDGCALIRVGDSVDICYAQ